MRARISTAVSITLLIAIAASHQAGASPSAPGNEPAAPPRAPAMSANVQQPLRLTSPILWEYTSAADTDSYTVGASNTNHGAEPILDIGHVAGTVPVDSSGFVKLPLSLPQNADVAVAYLTLSLLQPVQASASARLDRADGHGGQRDRSASSAPAANPLEVRACPASAPLGRDLH